MHRITSYTEDCQLKITVQLQANAYNVTVPFRQASAIHNPVVPVSNGKLSSTLFSPMLNILALTQVLTIFNKL